VEFGIQQEHKFHRDISFKRAGGLVDARGSTMVLPMEPSDVCAVILKFKIHKYGQEDGFIFLASNHLYHFKPDDGDLPALKQNCSLATQKLIKDGKRASTGISSLRYLVLKNQNIFIQQTTQNDKVSKWNLLFLLLGLPTKLCTVYFFPTH
jgi:hypothetical protein